MTDLHYISGIILLYASVVGCVLPFQKKINLNPVRPLSTGIVFAVALCHLLPDATKILDTPQVTDWFSKVTGLHGGGDIYDTLPVAETLMCLGIFIMLVIDQSIPCHHLQLPIENTVPLIEPPTNEREPLSTVAGAANLYGSSKSSHINKHTFTPSSAIEAAIEAGIPATNINTNTSIDTSTTLSHSHKQQRSNNVPHGKIYATEAAIAIHSIIIGFTIGINPDTSALIGLTIALIFHQLFEGMALAMIAVQGNLGFRSCCILVAMFSLSLPCGILIGLLTYRSMSVDGSNNDSDLNLETLFFQGVPNAIAAGMLLHIGFELLMKDFNHHEDNHTGSLQFPTMKLVLVFIGGAIISFLAIWA